MMKIKHLKIKVIITIVVIAVYALLFAIHAPCIFKTLFHIPCIGCGMTSAWLAALRLDFVSAFSYHKMFWSVPILYLYIIFDGKLFKNTIINNILLILIGIGFVANYIYIIF